MNKIFAFALLIFSFQIKYAFSQASDSVDFSLRIKSVITNPRSEYYYPKLKTKVKYRPKEISKMDCYYLYYGQIFQKDYTPLNFVIKSNTQDFDVAEIKTDCQDAIKIDFKILDRNPVNLIALMHVCNCMKAKKIPDTLAYYQKRFKNLIDAISLTGNSRSVSSAMKVVDLEDDYIIKGLLGLYGGTKDSKIENNHTYSIWKKDSTFLYFENLIKN